MSKNESTTPDGGGAGSAGSAGKLGALTTLTALVAALIVVLIAALLITLASRENAAESEAKLVNDSLYQSVFLTNGQVYFGKLSDVEEGYYRLTNIFYLQVQQQVQPTGTENAGTTPTTAPAAAGQTGQTQLVKLGDELHGPEDSMQINRDQVQFWENLKSDGSVAKAIDSYR